MDEKVITILNDICWVLSSLDDRITELERGEDGCGYTKSNWDNINAAMTKISEMSN